jgi:putative hydrolase of the HAD superfamily
MIKGIIWDFNRTLYDPDTSSLTSGAQLVLEDLSRDGYKMCLLSKKTNSNRETLIASLGIDKYFLDIQIVEEIKTEDDLRRCISKMALNASEIVVVGDRVRSELVLGKRLGMRTVWYRAGKFANETPRNSDEEPDHTIGHLEDIFKYIK